MYRPTLDPQIAATVAGAPREPIPWAAIPRTVWLLGITSLITDASSEMITSVLPAYLMFVARVSPATIGAIDGLYQGGASVARLLSGFASDHLRRYKEIAAVGYFSSAFSRIGLLAVGASPAGLGIVTLIDRVGKGIRTSPRDTLISLSAPPAGLAASFGVHRGLDTVGATLGPLVAFAILDATNSAYDVVFVVSFAIALVGVGVLVAFVRNPPSTPGSAVRSGAVVRPGADVGSGFSRTSSAPGGFFHLLTDRRFRPLAMAATLLGLATLSDSLIYLTLQRRTGLAASYLPLLFVATPAAYAVLAVPVGRLADLIGRGRVVVAGYAALVALYALLLTPSAGMMTVALVVALLGSYYAATDGVLPALASGLLPASSRATGLSMVGTGNDIGRLLSSVAFGAIWSRGSADAAILTFIVALGLALVAFSPTLLRFEAEHT